MSIDHVNQDGAMHRREVPAAQIYKWAKDNKYPQNLRVLCQNCNYKSYAIFRRTGQPLNTIRSLQRAITRWADVVFPSRSIDNTIYKLREEVQELIDEFSTGNPDSTINPGEFADVMILVLDLASLCGIDASIAMHDKLEINRKRQWTFDSNGLMQHIENVDG